jgi:hypothetical protein
MELDARARRGGAQGFAQRLAVRARHAPAHAARFQFLGREQSALADPIDVIGREHEVRRAILGMDRAHRVGEHERARAERVHDAHRERHAIGVTLVAIAAPTSATTITPCHAE